MKYLFILLKECNFRGKFYSINFIYSVIQSLTEFQKYHYMTSQMLLMITLFNYKFNLIIT